MDIRIRVLFALLIASVAITADPSTQCTTECKNNGSCNPQNGKCICPSNCEGEFCEVCHLRVPYGIILGALVGIIVTIAIVRWIMQTIRRRCVFYSPVAKDDPFVVNMKTISERASLKNSTEGDKFSATSIEGSNSSRRFKRWL
ncbi:hypothetical protein WA556_000759 [Blastocystis sp. ATCC 50177/Nand II]